MQPHLADQLGLEEAIAGSPGWSESGGPWVPPAEGMKKYVWSETVVEGGKPFTGVLAHPPIEHRRISGDEPPEPAARTRHHRHPRRSFMRMQPSLPIAGQQADVPLDMAHVEDDVEQRLAGFCLAQ